MVPPLVFVDAATAADALTFARRAARLGEDASLRLQARDGVLLLTTAVLAPRGLLDPSPTVLASRTARVDPELVCDVVVDPALLAPGVDAASLALPESGLSVGWAGVAPPRAGWSTAGEVAASVVAAAAQRGMAEVAGETSATMSEEALRTVRARVWGAPEPALHGLPLGAAFAAFTLGFVSGEEAARLYAAERWSRLTFARGHVLVRLPARTGLTPVRTTG
ncbi:hypothetical protein ABCS02_23555 [Microbacterium sp. X-17]|uniref:hypothetical protein n=1 Tax=Microbacterium sp. X-17 TaxID=3144404 RepID=UPI0031F5584D